MDNWTYSTMYCRYIDINDAAPNIELGSKHDRYEFLTSLCNIMHMFHVGLIRTVGVLGKGLNAS